MWEPDVFAQTNNKLTPVRAWTLTSDLLNRLQNNGPQRVGPFFSLCFQKRKKKWTISESYYFQSQQKPRHSNSLEQSKQKKFSSVAQSDQQSLNKGKYYIKLFSDSCADLFVELVKKYHREYILTSVLMSADRLQCIIM